MLKTDYEQVLADTPHWAPVFMVARAPEWFDRYDPTDPRAPRKGMELWGIGGQFYPVLWGGGGLGVTPGYLRFVEYRKLNPWLKHHNLRLVELVQ